MRLKNCILQASNAKRWWTLIFVIFFSVCSWQVVANISTGIGWPLVWARAYLSRVYLSVYFFAVSGDLDSAIGIDLGTPHSCFSVGQNERSVYYSRLFLIGYLPPFPVSQLERKFFFPTPKRNCLFTAQIARYYHHDVALFFTGWIVSQRPAVCVCGGGRYGWIHGVFSASVCILIFDPTDILFLVKTTYISLPRETSDGQVTISSFGVPVLFHASEGPNKLW